jgi:uncharacterized protein YggE
MPMRLSSLAAATLLALIATTADAREPTRLTVSATADVAAQPDLAQIGAGVMTRADTAEAALMDNSQRMARVVRALRQAGVADRDIQTSGLNLQPQFRYEPNREPVPVGFQATNRVQVRLRDLTRAGRVIDALVREGANQIDGPTFEIAEPEPLMDRARVEAVRRARARADIYASAAGLRVTRIAAISEGHAIRPVPMPRAAMAMEARADTPVEPGEVALSVVVTMEFELEP